MATANPYLTGAVDALRQQSNQNLRNNVLPGLNSGAIAAGGFGGSRNRIAQGLAVAGAETGLNNAAANLYANAYETDANRAQALQIANMQDSTNRYGIDQNAAQAAARLGLDTQVAGWNRDYNQGQLALGNRTADQNYALGMGNLGVAQQNAGTNAQSVANQYALGMGNLDLGRTQAANQLELGRGNLALGNRQADQSYDLGLRNNDLGFYNADISRELGLGNLQNQATANQNSFYTAQRGQDLQGQQLGLQALTQGNNMALQNALGLSALGQNEQNAAFQQLQQYANLLQPWSGLGGSTSQTSPEQGGGWAGALGGGLAAYQLWQALTRGGG